MAFLVGRKIAGSLKHKLLQITAAIVLVTSCSTGLDRQMAAVLDQVEDNLGYVNTVETANVAKMTEWFIRRGDDASKARALYCLGRSQFNDRNYSAAIVSYTEALDFAGKAGDSLHEGLVCFDMAHTCAASGNSSDEMLYLARAAESFKAAGLTAESQRALLEIGEVKASLGAFDDAEGIFKRILYDSHELGDTLLEVKCLESYASLAVSRDDPDPSLAIDMLGRAAGELKYPLTCSDKGILAYSYSLAGHKEEAAKWLADARSAVESDAEAADIDFREYQIASRSGDTGRALKALEKVTEYGNRTQAAALEETVAASQREYIQRQSETQAEKLRAARMRLLVFLLVALLAFAALAAAYLYYRSQQRRRLEAEIAERDRYMTIAEDLRQALRQVAPAGDSVGYPVGAPAGEPTGPVEPQVPRPVGRVEPQGPGFEVLERLCEQYYIYEGTENLQPKILKEVKSIIGGLRSDRKVQKGLEAMLDASKDGVMTKLRKEFPSWKEDDCLLCSFAASGFSSTTISALMEKEKRVVYNRVWRLKGRISNSESPLKEFFLLCLEN